MSLYSSIRMASNTLQANTIALQVVGQNIANSNDPNYIREQVVMEPGPSQRLGGLLLGTGTRVLAVTQKIDNFLEDRLRGAVSDQASAEAQEQTYTQLEGAIGELNDTDLSTSMTKFFSSISEILNQPESATVRNLAVLQGQTLTNDIRTLASRVQELRSDANTRVQNMAGDINRLVEEVRSLNVRIAETEVGGACGSDAVGLRDQRLKALEGLATLIDIRVEEQESGATNVYVGGDYLVCEGTARQVEAQITSVGGMGTATIALSSTDSPLEVSGGQLYGLMASRDQVLGSFQDNLNSFAGTLAFEFNKIYSSGQGLKGFASLSSEYPVSDNTVPLDDAAAGLKFPPVNGSFQVLVYNTKSGLTQTTDIRVDLNGLGEDTTLEDLAAQLDAIDGLSAQATPTGMLEIRSDAVDQQFSFANDTSGVLAALGLNTFFTGSSASDLGINGYVSDDPSLFAASTGGIGQDTDNAVELAAFADRALSTRNNESISVIYDRTVGEVTQGATIASATADGARVFEETLRGQKLAISGVSIDEEAVKMIAYQQSYQASARYIKTLNDLLELMVNL